MRLLHQRLCLFPRQAGQGHHQFDRQRETALVIGPDAHRGVDAGSLQGDLLLPGDMDQRVLEAGGIAAGEQLLGVGARAATASQTFGQAQLQIQRAIVGGHVAAAAADGRGMGFIEDVH